MAATLPSRRWRPRPLFAVLERRTLLRPSRGGSAPPVTVAARLLERLLASIIPAPVASQLDVLAVNSAISSSPRGWVGPERRPSPRRRWSPGAGDEACLRSAASWRRRRPRSAAAAARRGTPAPAVLGLLLGGARSGAWVLLGAHELALDPAADREEVTGADGVVVAGDHALDDVGVAVGVDHRDDRCRACWLGVAMSSFLRRG